MKIVNENKQYPQMSDARFARLIKTIKNSSYMEREDGKTFARYRGEPPETKIAVAGGPAWYPTHRIKLIDNNVIYLKTESTHNDGFWYLSDSQMKELVDALNEVPDKRLAWKD